MDLLEELGGCLKKKREMSQEAHTGYIIWKARCLNYGQIIMNMRRRQMAAESEYNNDSIRKREVKLFSF
jgi:hypothetical protein